MCDLGTVVKEMLQPTTVWKLVWVGAGGGKPVSLLETAWVINPGRCQNYLYFTIYTVVRKIRL